MKGVDRALRQAGLFYRRVLHARRVRQLVGDRHPGGDQDRSPESIDVVVTTSPPPSINLIGAAVKRATGVPWVADLRDSIAANPDRRVESLAVRVKERGQRMVAQLVARSADAVVAVTSTIGDEMRELGAERVEVIPNGSDFDDFEGLEYRRGDRFRITHTGTFFGKRDPRPFMEALSRSGPEVVARFVGGLRQADQEWAEAGPRRPDRGAPARAPPPGARAAARFGGTAAPAARGGRTREDGALGKDLRVPGSRAADPRRRASRRRGRADGSGGRRGHRRPAGRRRLHLELRSTASSSAGRPALSTARRSSLR